MTATSDVRIRRSASPTVIVKPDPSISMSCPATRSPDLRTIVAATLAWIAAPTRATATATRAASRNRLDMCCLLSCLSRRRPSACEGPPGQTVSDSRGVRRRSAGRTRAAPGDGSPRGCQCFICIMANVGRSRQAVPDRVHRTRLDNGLTVLIQEVGAAPLVSVWCWYRVGSKDERSEEHTSELQSRQ